MKDIKWINLLLELLVVIIGITIAFSLDNWKENKKAKNAQLEYFVSFKNDLEKDTLDLTTLIDTLSHQKRNCEKLITCIFSNDFDNKNLLDYSISLFFVTTFVPHSATYKSLTSSGQLQSIKDFELRKKIVDQYDITYSHLKLLDDFNQNQVFNYRTPFLHDNMTYKQNGIENTEVMKSSKYINITMSSYYFLDKKIQEYTNAKNNAKELIKTLNQALIGN